MGTINDLNHLPIIRDLSEDDQHSIRPYLKMNQYEEGKVVLKQQQQKAEFHIIVEGTFDVFVEQKTKVPIATLAKGHFFGEMSCLTGSVVSATVQANEPAVTVSLTRDGILKLMDKSAIFRKHMIDAMTERIMNSNDRVLEEHTRNVAMYRQLQQEQQGKYGVFVGDSKFVQQLKQAMVRLSQMNAPLCIFGEKGVGKSHVAWEIHGRSKRSSFPIIQMDAADFSIEEWEGNVQAANRGTIVLEKAETLPVDLLNRLLQSQSQAHIVFTAKEKLPIKIEHLEIIPLRERKEDLLALIYTFISQMGVTEPEKMIAQESLNLMHNFPFLGGNIKELKSVIQEAYIRSNGKIIRNSHLRFGSMREPGTRPKIGLALGSGSVKGAAHVGVIKVLEEAGIPIDMIAGTSVGAFIGALYVGGQPTDRFEEVLPTVRWRQLVQPVIPHKGLVNNQLMERFVEKYIGSVRFEELPIPFAAVASDATNGEPQILNKGKVSRAVCASTAIPGVMRPVKYGEKMLLDGAVAQPVPVALVKSMGADIVIAVDLSTPNTIKKAPKNLIATILNTIDIMSERMIQDELQLADFVLTPWLETNQLTFKESAAYIQKGEEVAQEIEKALKDKMNAMTNR